MNGKKLPWNERHSQLIQIGLQIVEEEGTDALTLGNLAEKAGVSRPIAYQHFETRTGLLKALFEFFDQKTENAVREALQNCEPTRNAISKILISAYVDCFASAGKSASAVIDSLSSTEELRTYRQEWRERLADFHTNLLGQFSDLPEKELNLHFLGYMGAAETLCGSMLAGSVSRDQAIASLTRLLNAVLGTTEK